jgi:hypothetical protein
VPYNKITSIMQWIEAKHDQLPADAIVCIIDVDVVLLEDISFLAVGVGKGKPRGAKGAPHACVMLRVSRCASQGSCHLRAMTRRTIA